VLFPLFEEIGWRGYALPRLSARHGPVVASALLGVIWAVWHVPMFLAVSATPLSFPVGLVFFVAGSVVFAWFALRTGYSLFVAVMLHAGAHLNNSNAAPGGNDTPLVLHTIGFVVVAVALLVVDRARFRRQGPADVPAGPGA
jgi:membrane protease YdiL (CAAX protease family)